MKRQKLKYHGVGFECPIEFTDREDIEEVLEKVELIEIIPESYFHNRRKEFLLKLKKSGTPVVVHSVDMSLGSAEAFKQKHFDHVKRVIDQVNCVVFSDHLCMTSAAGIEIGQLTTLPFCEEVVDVVCEKIEIIKKQTSLPFMIENITNRFILPGNTLSETDFINRVITQSGCGLLLDITNVFINSVNYKFDPYKFISALKLDQLMGIHLAGGIIEDKYFYDTHSEPVHDEAWDLLKFVTEIADPKAIVVEWDQHAPTLGRLMEEVEKAKAIVDCSPRRIRASISDKFPEKKRA